MRGMRLIAGSGRSGTTWILDAVATANGLRPVFEPLHPYVSKVGDRYAYRALEAGTRIPELEEFLAATGAGRRLPLWTKYRRQARWLLPPHAEFSTRRHAGRAVRRWGKFLRELPKLAAASRRARPLFKCIRANLMLDWLVRDHAWKVVLIVRHPAAVVESELRGSWSAEFALDRFRHDRTLQELTDGRYDALLAGPLSPVEALAVRWVIENQWVVERAAATGYTVVHYEHLRSSPESAWHTVIGALDLDRVPAAALLAMPSQQSAPGRAGKDRTPYRSAWQRRLSGEQTQAIQRVLDRAGCGLYSIDDTEPCVPAPQRATT